MCTISAYTEYTECVQMLKGMKNTLGFALFRISSVQRNRQIHSRGQKHKSTVVLKETEIEATVSPEPHLAFSQLSL